MATKVRGGSVGSAPAVPFVTHDYTQGEGPRHTNIRRVTIYEVFVQSVLLLKHFSVGDADRGVKGDVLSPDLRALRQLLKLSKSYCFPAEHIPQVDAFSQGQALTLLFLEGTCLWNHQFFD